MRSRGCFVMLPTVLFAVSLSAGNTRIQLFSAALKSSCRGGVARAVPRCVSGCGNEAITAKWAFRDGSAETEIPLSSDRSWEITIGGEGCWAPPIIVAAGNNGETRTAFVWPTATIAGNFVMQKGERSPRELRATVQTDDAASIDGAISETPLDCVIHSVHWRCILPSAKVDLRIAAEGFVPHYLWGLHASVGEEKAVEVALIRGGSVSGRVAVASRQAELDGTDILLRPASVVNTLSEERHIASRSQRAKPNARGFFQFSGIGDGVYEVIASKAGWSRAARQVRVAGAKESDTGILILPPLARAEVIIDPPADTRGRRWRIVLDRDGAATQPRPPIADRQAAADGSWSQSGLEAGQYRLEIFDGGNIVRERLVANVQPNQPPLHLRMDAISVRGIVRVGHEALAATLHFLSRRGPGELELASDDDGLFVGSFPALGQYEVEIKPKGSSQRLRKQVEVRQDADGNANIDIDLPGGVVRGTLMNEAGEPVTGTVRVYHTGSPAISTSASDDGTFLIIGVEVGDVILNAKSRQAGDSGPVPYVISEGISQPVILTLHARREVTLWIVSPSGQPVSGAVVRFSNQYFWHEEVTGPSGDAHGELPRGIDAIDIIIAAIGFPTKIVKLPITPEMETNPQIMLGRAAATLIVKVGSAPPWPMVRLDQSNADLHSLMELFSSPLGGPSLPNRTSRGFEFEVDPGTYTFCPDRNVSSKCVQKMLAPGIEAVVDLASWSEERSAQ
jgi:hypothetical protein